MNQPLAFRLRPNSIDEIVGQSHLVSKGKVIRKCIENNTVFSCIFYGPPGCGKTTLAEVIAKSLNKPFRKFNAVTGNKKDLDLIFEEAKLTNQLIVLVDEVHRLNKDKQDLLLPHVESGLIIMIGATTANPFHAINPAIRSRCHLFELKPISDDDIITLINNAIKHEFGFNNNLKILDSSIKLIASYANGDVRFALNLLEISATISNNNIDDEVVKSCCENINQRNFKDDDGYYDLLSCFQKSIRGSDVNAALVYLSLLSQNQDIESINRRLEIIAYEDIGLANPSLTARVKTVCDIASHVGFPEAIIPLGTYVIELCLSAKSRTAIDAIYKAKNLINSKSFDIPYYLKLTPTGPKDEIYNYSRTDCFHKIQYLPEQFKNVELIDKFNSNQYEKYLEQVYNELKKIKRTSNLKDLYNKQII